MSVNVEASYQTKTDELNFNGKTYAPKNSDLPIVSSKFRDLAIFKTLYGKYLEKFLRDMCPDLSLLDDIVEITNKDEKNKKQNKNNNKNEKLKNQLIFTEKQMIVKGYVQSGKTKFMVAMAKLYQACGYSTIIMLRNITMDRIQLVDRINQINEEFNKGLDSRDIESTLDIQVMDELCPAEDICKILSKEARICICIANEYTMEKIGNCLQEVIDNGKNCNYTLFIDEVDLVDSTSADIRNPYLEIIKENASLTVGVSATIIATAAEWNLKPTCIREIAKPANYLGIQKLLPIRVNTGENTTVKGDDIDEIFESVPSLKAYIHKFSKKDLICDAGGEKYPYIGLIRVCTDIAPQRAIRDYILNKYSNIATILCVESGIDMTHKSLGKVSFNGSRIIEQDGKIIHHFSSERLDVGGAIAIFEELGIKKVSRIYCIAGKKASRSVSFSSSKGGLNRWRVSEMYAKLAYSTSMDEIMQIAGRVCGIFDTSCIHQHIYASGSDLDAIRKAYWTQEDILNETSRKYGKVVDSRIKSHYGSDEYVPAKVYERNMETFNKLTEELFDDLELSEWKMCVEGSTKGGKKRKVPKRLTMRYEHSNMVKDDGRKVSEKEFDFEEKEVNENFGKKVVSEDMDEEKYEKDITDVFLVDRSKLGPKSQEYYDIIVAYMKKNKGKWLVKSEVINNLSVNNKKMYIAISNGTWNWVKNSNGKDIDDCICKGLLLSNMNGKIIIRYN